MQSKSPERKKEGQSLHTFMNCFPPRTTKNQIVPRPPPRSNNKTTLSYHPINPKTHPQTPHTSCSRLTSLPELWYASRRHYRKKSAHLFAMKQNPHVNRSTLVVSLCTAWMERKERNETRVRPTCFAV